ncbi:MAG: helix-turn-helix domain-containing protein [Massilia sp.]
MAKRNQQLNSSVPHIDLGQELLASVREMKSNVRARTHQPVVSEIASARVASGLSQAAFASLMGVSVRTLQDWEQGRREPSGAARTLIKVAERHPEVLRELFA